MSITWNSNIRTRIVYINHTGLVSGAEKVLLNILRGLDRRRYEPILVCPADGRLVQQAAAEEIPWIPIRPIRAQFSRNPKKLIHSFGDLSRGVLELRKVLRSLAPDLIHANTVRAGIAASLATLGGRRKVIWHVHDLLPRHPLSTLIRLLAFFHQRTHLIAVSHATAERFCGHLPFKDRMKTIHNGIALTNFPCKRRGRAPFRELLGFSDDDFLLCAIGQICERKGLLELIGAFRQAHSSEPRLHLVIVGSVVFKHEESYRDLVYSAARAPDLSSSVHFIGEMKDIYPVLEAANLLVLNSREEPFGLVLIEAMSSGTPVLATRVGGIPEIVIDAENGWLIEPGNTHALAEKLLELPQDPAALERAAQKALTDTCPQFSLEQFQSRLERLYDEIEPKSDLRKNLHNPPSIAQTMKRRGVPYA